MKILTRTLIILLVAAVVVGIVWLIGNSGLVSGLDSFSGGGGEGNGGGNGNGGGKGNGNGGRGNRNSASGELPEDFEGREHDGVGWIQSWADFLKTLVPIAVIIVVVRLIAFGWDKIRRRNFPKAAV